MAGKRTTKKATESEKVTEEKPLTPAEYFEKVKAKMDEETEDNLKNLYQVTLDHLKRFMVTGQVSAAKLLYGKCLALQKEVEVVKRGITKYVNRDLIDEFIDKVADKTVLIIELKNYERDIPDEIVDKVAATKDLFDDFYIVFTDYTGEKRKKVAKERRDKDPILFGNIFEDGVVSKKMYFIGDWVDEYCDLTLNGMLEQVSRMRHKDVKATELPNFEDLDSIKKALFAKEDD